MSRMRIVKGVALRVGAFVAVAAMPMIVLANELQQPLSVQQSSFEYSTFSADEAKPSKSPSDVKPAPQAVIESSGCGCDALCCESDCCACGPWGLPQPRCLACRGIKVGGWIDQGISFNADRPANRYNGPVQLNSRDRDYQLNQLWLYIDKPMDTKGCGWDIGGRFDIVYGTDWRCGTSQGLEDRINAPDQLHGLILPQLYTDIGVNDLSVRIGHWAPTLGYELVPAVGNFFYSHSYAMCTEPLLVTGVQAEYKLSERLLLSGGFNRGWSKWEDNNNCLDFLGGVKYKSYNDRTKLSFMIENGAWDDTGNDNRFTYIFVWRQELASRLSYGLQHTYGVQETTDFGNAEWYGICQYLFYKLNSKWSAGTRIEWMRDDKGMMIRSNGCGPNGIGPGAGFAGDFTELTFGLNWKPIANVVVRPEVRWDWYQGGANPNGYLPFNDGTDKDQFLFAVDAIVTF